MNAIRKVEVFSAGWPACDDVIDLIKQAACPSCEITVLDMHDAKVAARAKVSSPAACKRSRSASIQ